MKHFIMTGLFSMMALCIQAQETDFSRHYRGSVEIDGGVGANHSTGTIGVSTIHGIQLTPYSYLGVGMNVNYHTRWKETSLPFLIDFKVNATKGKIRPYADLRGGYSFINIKGFYMSPGIGVACPTAGGTALTFSVAYLQQEQRNPSVWYHNKTYRDVVLRVGYSF